jgi:hypothetical protein
MVVVIQFEHYGSRIHTASKRYELSGIHHQERHAFFSRASKPGLDPINGRWRSLGFQSQKSGCSQTSAHSKATLTEQAP